jgi:hypothetical protein
MILRVVNVNKLWAVISASCIKSHPGYVKAAVFGT